MKYLEYKQNVLTCPDYSESKFYNTCNENRLHYNKAGIAE